MFNELRQKQPFYTEITHHYLEILLHHIQRITHCEVTTYSAVHIPNELETVKTYIDSHYQDIISLEGLARLSNWDKYYFSHMFTKTFGISPINYLLERRILHSKDLLIHTDHSIAQVAESTGFSSQNYFAQAFKKHTGETPVQYRKRHRTEESSLSRRQSLL